MANNAVAEAGPAALGHGCKCSPVHAVQADESAVCSSETFAEPLDSDPCSYAPAKGQAQLDGIAAWRLAFEGPHRAAPIDAPGGLGIDVMGMLRQHMSVEDEVAVAHGFLDHSLAPSPAEALTPGMRMIVVSWMVEVAEEFRLQQETLHLAIGLLDRFLCSTQDVPRCVLQLLAVACVLLAAKDLEVVQPTVEQLCAVTANHFKPQDLLRMERIVLDVLEFCLSCPSSYTFLHLLAQAGRASVTPGVLSLAMYLCELAVLEYEMHYYKHSTRAAAALLLAQVSVGDPNNLPALASVVRRLDIPLPQLAGCMAALLQLQQAAYHHNVATAAAAAGCYGTAPPASDAVGDLLAPLRVKFGAGCWCEVSACAPIMSVPHLQLWGV